MLLILSIVLLLLFPAHSSAGIRIFNRKPLLQGVRVAIFERGSAVAFDLRPQTLSVPCIESAALFDSIGQIKNSLITSNLVQDLGDNVIQAEDVESIFVQGGSVCRGTLAHG